MGEKSKEPPVDVKALHAKTGELILEDDFLEGWIAEPKAVIDCKH